MKELGLSSCVRLVAGRCVKTVEDKRGLEIGGRRAGDK